MSATLRVLHLILNPTPRLGWLPLYGIPGLDHRATHIAMGDRILDRSPGESVIDLAVRAAQGHTSGKPEGFLRYEGGTSHE